MPDPAPNSQTTQEGEQITVSAAELQSLKDKAAQADRYATQIKTIGNRMGIEREDDVLAEIDELMGFEPEAPVNIPTKPTPAAPNPPNPAAPNPPPPAAPARTAPDPGMLALMEAKFVSFEREQEKLRPEERSPFTRKELEAVLRNPGANQMIARATVEEDGNPWDIAGRYLRLKMGDKTFKEKQEAANKARADLVASATPGTGSMPPNTPTPEAVAVKELVDKIAPDTPYSG